VKPPAILGQLLPSGNPGISPAFWDLLRVAGVLVGLCLVIFIIVPFIRKGRPAHRSRARRGPEILRNSEELLREKERIARGEAEPEERSGNRHRRRRKRRGHRPRNPTLAESGGLPPDRDADSRPDAGL
jgi:uncharacterized membrane protein